MVVEKKSYPAALGVGAVCNELRVVTVDEGFILGSVVEAFLQKANIEASLVKVVEKYLTLVMAIFILKLLRKSVGVLRNYTKSARIDSACSPCPLPEMR